MKRIHTCILIKQIIKLSVSIQQFEFLQMLI